MRHLSRQFRRCLSPTLRVTVVVAMTVGMAAPALRAQCCCPGGSCAQDESRSTCCHAAECCEDEQSHCCGPHGCGENSLSPDGCRCAECPSRDAAPNHRIADAKPENEPIAISHFMAPAAELADRYACDQRGGFRSTPLEGLRPPDRLARLCVWIL